MLAHVERTIAARREQNRVIGRHEVGIGLAAHVLVGHAADSLVVVVRVDNEQRLRPAVEQDALFAVRRTVGLGVMRLAAQLDDLLDLQRAGVDNQESSGVFAGRHERTFSGRQVDPLAIRRYAESVRLEYVLPAPGQDVVFGTGHDFARVCVDDRKTWQRHAAQQAAVTGTFGGDEDSRVFLGIPRIGPRRIKTVLEVDVNAIRPVGSPAGFLAI